MQQRRNLIVFVILSSVIIIGWTFLQPVIQPLIFPKAQQDEVKKPEPPKPTPAPPKLSPSDAELVTTLAASLAPEQTGGLPMFYGGVQRYVRDGAIAYTGVIGQVPDTAGAAGLGNSLLAQGELRKIPLPPEQKKPTPEPPIVQKPPPRKSSPPIVLGSASKDSPYFLFAKFDPLGACVRQVILNRFEKADDMGRLVTDADGVPERLELIREEFNREVGSFLLYHSPKPDAREERPLDTLGLKRVWAVEKAPTVGQLVGSYTEGGDLKLRVQNRETTFVVPEELRASLKPLDGQQVAVVWKSDGDKFVVLKILAPDADDPDLREVAFSTEIDAVKYTKTFSLQPGDYHLGLDVKMEARKAVTVRYVLTSGHGMPIEGGWYTHVFRNAIIGLVDQNGSASRSLQDLRQIVLKGGGDPVFADDKTPSVRKAIQYGGVVTQFFASVVAVGEVERTPAGPFAPKMFIDHATPTLVSTAIHGRLKAEPDGGYPRIVSSTDSTAIYWLVFPTSPEDLKAKLSKLKVGEDPSKPRVPLIVPEAAVEQRAKLRRLKEDDPVGVTALLTPADTYEVQQVFVGEEAHKLIFADISVHMVSNEIPLTPDKAEVHHYVLYHGPVKVRLLGQLGGDSQVSDTLVSVWSGDSLYLDKLHLNTLTDAPWDWWGQGFFTWTGLTSLLLATTNLMHTILWALHTYVFPWSWGVCIILLTVLVRGLMHPLSRKATLNTLKMQAMQPELKKLKEKYKDDQQAMAMAQMELYRKHKVSVFGSCWTMFLQMPIFMGLYWALQESIHFRLAPFIPGLPWWIQNLAAPDMLFQWFPWMPFVSDPANYGAIYYLGPYFNLLPVIAATLMLFVQKMMMPPPTTEQEEMQQRMMKWMPIVMCVMFFKVASGLCIYFIASSLWGLAERKLLLPKKHPDHAPGAGDEKKEEESKPGIFARTMEKWKSAVQQQQESAGSTPASPPSDRVDSSSGGRKNRRQRKRDRDRQQKGRKTGGGGAPSNPTTNGSSNGGLLDRLRAWWKDVLRNAEKR